MAAKKAKAPVAPAKTLNAAFMERLMAAAVSARENNGSDQFTDGENRHWFVGVETVGNSAKVLIQAKKGQDVREAYLSTATFAPDLVEQAITKIDGELP